MQLTYLILNWLFGALLCLLGAISIIEAPMAGLTLIAMSLFLLPPVRTFIYSKTNKKLSVKVKSCCILALFLAFSVTVSIEESKKEQELAAQKAKELKQEQINYFNANRENILQSIKESVAAKDYQSAITQSQKYLVVGDVEIRKIHSNAKAHFAEIQKAEKTNKLLAELKTIPAKEFKKNKELYQQLANLHPDNETYKNKVAYYSGKIKAEKQKQAAIAKRKEKIEEQFSAWDGSHINLAHLIKKNMNDPDSYKHDETVYWDRGDHLIIQTTYRGKNAFGAMVRNSVKAKVSLNGQILGIL